MDLLQFLEMGVAETLLLSIACFISVLALNGIGSVFVKSVDNEKLFCLQTTVGLAFVAVLALLAVSYCAALAKYIIYTFLAISFLLMVRRIYKKNLSANALFRSVLPALVIYVCFVILLMSYIFTHVGTIDYNCHMIYCSAIPEEIYKADYFSRLRIVDVYPCEWSKFHMFNGCMSAIPLAVFPLKNIVTFNLAKFATIALLIGTIYEGLLRRYGFKKTLKLTVIIVFIFAVCANRFTLWTLFINNYSSFLIMAILWLILSEAEYAHATILSMILAVATSKSTITGLVLFALSLYRLSNVYGKSIKEMIHKECLTAVCCLVFGFGCISMLVSGENPANEQLLHPNLVENITNPAWVSMFFFGDALNAFIRTKDVFSMGCAIAMVILYIVVIAMKRKKILHFIKVHLRGVAYTTLLVSGLYVMYWMQGHNSSFALSASFFAIPLRCVFLYVLPIICVFACCEKQMYTPLQLFVVFAFVQFMLLNSDNGACNYCLIMFPLALYIARCVLSLLDRVPTKLSLALLVVLFGIALYQFAINDIYKVFVWAREDAYHTALELSEIEYLGDVPYEYDGPSDAGNVMLNSLKGNRIHYDIKPDQHDPDLAPLSMSMRFVSSADYANYPS